jgi:hypothetical protein
MCGKPNNQTRLKFASASAGIALTLLALVELHGLQVLA